MQGTLVTGEDAAAGFVAATSERLAEAVGFRPFPGTLNLEGVEGVESLERRSIDDVGDDRCEGVHLRPCRVGGVSAAVIRPLVPEYPATKTELLAAVRLRDLFGLDVGATVPVSPPDEAWTPDGPAAEAASLDRFDAVVFDLDGTLVDLAVDWAAVHDDIETRFGRYLEKPVRSHTQNELFAVAAEHGVYDDLAGMLADRERDGAASASALAGIDALEDVDAPVGLCTANAERAAEVALARFGVRDAVDAIVARETVRPGKPDPGPLLACLDRLASAPGNAVFVGDEPTDAETAVRAGTSFLHVEQLWPPG